MMSPKQLTGKTDDHLNAVLVGQKNFWIHPQVSQDLLALKQAADSAGFNFNIASGFRSFARQQSIWNRKMSGELAILDEASQPIDTTHYSEEQRVWAILRWSALPGASRHHWGTDFDVFDRHGLPAGESLQLEPWEYLQAHQHPFYLWLKAHIEPFGFFFPYQQNGIGVAFEPWHISHRLTAERCLTQLTLDVLAEQLAPEQLLGKQTVLQNLETIYNQYIINIA